MSTPELGRELTLSHGRTTYLETGAGAPLVLLHGVLFHAASETWLPVLRRLGEHFHVYAPDFVGWGPGDQLEQGYSFAYLVDFVREFQDSLGIARSHVVGHSMGGWVAALLAYESPDRVDRLVLAANGGLAVRPLAAMQSWQPASAAEIGDHYARYDRDEVDVESLVAAAIRRTEDPERVRRFASIMAHMTQGETRRRYELSRRLAHIGAPTLVIWGSDDPINPPALAGQAADLLSSGRSVLVPAAGHFLQIDAPSQFVQLVTDFLLASGPDEAVQDRSDDG